MKATSIDSCDVILCLIGLTTGVTCILMRLGHQDTRPQYAHHEHPEAEWDERLKTKIGNAFCEIILCFAILLMGFGLHARSPWGGEKEFGDVIAWTGFLIDVGLVGKTIWHLYCNNGRKLQKRVHFTINETTVKEFYRQENSKKGSEKRERRRLHVERMCRNWLEDVECYHLGKTERDDPN